MMTKEMKINEEGVQRCNEKGMDKRENEEEEEEKRLGEPLLLLNQRRKMDVDGKGDFVLSPKAILVIKKNLNCGCVQHFQWVHIEFPFKLLYKFILNLTYSLIGLKISNRAVN